MDIPNKSKCPKSERCKYGDCCPENYEPLSDYYACFERGGYDKYDVEVTNRRSKRVNRPNSRVTH